LAFKSNYYYHSHHHFRSRFHKQLKTWYLAFWTWFTLLNMMISSSINFPANDIILFLLWFSNISFYMYLSI
jgi:hypothetical protein